jgi:hypothetical protein
MSRPEVEFDLKVQQNLVIEPSRRHRRRTKDVRRPPILIFIHEILTARRKKPGPWSGLL